jgi:cysteine desulfuration protein SufE
MTSIEKRQEDIVRSFENLGDWMDKYEYLIDLGKRRPPMDAALKKDANAISGCQSKVWMTADIRDGKVHFLIDSDTLITKGLIGLLLRVLDRESPGAIDAADLFFIERIGLHSHLSPARANGLGSIVKHMKRIARSEQNRPQNSITVEFNV